MSINSSQPIQPTPPVSANGPVRSVSTEDDSGVSFKEVLESSIREVNTLQEKTEGVLNELRLGKTDEGTTVMSQIEKKQREIEAGNGANGALYTPIKL